MSLRPVLCGLAALSLLALVACAKPLPTRAPLNVSPLALSDTEWRVVDRVVLITDASGTMYVNETFPEAKSLTQAFVAGMPAGDVRGERPGGYEAGLIGFGGDARSEAPLRSFDRAALSGKAGGLEVMGDLSGRGGTTPLHAVLYEVGQALANGQGPTAVVIFSDGMPDDPKVALAQAAELPPTSPEGLCIHAVHVGTDQEGREFLRSLSRITDCGTLRLAGDLNNPSAFTSFSHAVFVGEAKLPPVGAVDPCVTVTRLEGIEFDFDSERVSANSGSILDVVVEKLRMCPDISIRVEGHTDSVGPPGYNQGLSERRARAVRRYFIESEVIEERLSVEGFGAANPIAPNETPDGRSRNRRVELRPVH